MTLPGLNNITFMLTYIVGDYFLILKCKDHVSYCTSQH
jgi:hypothetical protein